MEELGFPGGPVVKNLPANTGGTRDSGSILRSGKSPGVGNGNPLQHSCLENSMDRVSLAGYSPWGCKEMDTTEQQRACTHTHTHTHTHTLPWHFRLLCNTVLYSIGLSLPDASTAEHHFCFVQAASSFLELSVIALHSSPVAYWTPSELGGSPSGVISFCLFILFVNNVKHIHIIYIKQAINRELLHSIGTSAQRSVVTCVGEESEKE